MNTTTDQIPLETPAEQLIAPLQKILATGLNNLFTNIQAALITLHEIPRIGTEWPGQGGIYAGVMRGENGKPDYHLIVPTHPDASIEKITWCGSNVNEPGANHEFDGFANTIALCESKTEHPAAEWAAYLVIEGRTDFYLPSRRELSLMYANVPEFFEQEWHWSSTQYPFDTGYAWSQHFNYGYQYDDGKAYARRARAVRRLEIY